MSGGRLAARLVPPPAERLARAAERLLRAVADVRVGLALLLVVAAAHAVAAALPGGPQALDGPFYALLLGVVVLSGLAAFAVRAPASWREWRRPGPVPDAGDVVVERIALDKQTDAAAVDRVGAALRRAGYRVRVEQAADGRWALYGVRRGWSRFAAQSAHLAMVLLVVGAAAGAAFGSETTFSLLPGEQALLDTPRDGFSEAVRLEAFDAEFGPDDRPLRLDTEVAFLSDGEVVERATLQVNAPGTFGGYVVHPWTYGPAAELRVTTLGGRPLLDAAVPLDRREGGRPFGLVELPAAGLTLGLALVDPEANELAVSVAGTTGVIDVAHLRPGDEVRVGDLLVGLEGFSAWVTFLSRSDPGLGILFAGAGLLTASLAAAFWFPRRRLALRWSDGSVRIALRGERADRPRRELARVHAIVASVT
jgi:cytochrome c biogenesis protein ResB